MSTCTPWATAADAPENYEGDPDVLERAFALSSDVLYELTGRQWPGTCHDKVRPLAQWRESAVPRWWPFTFANGSSARGGWGFCSCHRGRETGCNYLSEIRLPGNSVHVDTLVVKVDGVEVTDYQLHDGRYLVRTGPVGWPCCQQLTLADTEDRTFSVEYDFGPVTPAGAVAACIAYGEQLAYAMDPALSIDKCQLPRRVTTITRLNITQIILDPMTLVKDGMIGLSAVDQWVQSILIGAKRRSATVLVPGQQREHRRIG